MKIWVAYNAWGDLIADAFSYKTLLRRIRETGYGNGDVTIGRVAT